MSVEREVRYIDAVGAGDGVDAWARSDAEAANIGIRAAPLVHCKGAVALAGSDQVARAAARVVDRQALHVGPQPPTAADRVDPDAGCASLRLGAVAPDTDRLLAQVEASLNVIRDAALGHRVSAEVPHALALDLAAAVVEQLPLFNPAAVRGDKDVVLAARGAVVHAGAIGGICRLDRRPGYIF